MIRLHIFLIICILIIEVTSRWLISRRLIYLKSDLKHINNMIEAVVSTEKNIVYPVYDYGSQYFGNNFLSRVN